MRKQLDVEKVTRAEYTPNIERKIECHVWRNVFRLFQYIFEYRRDWGTIVLSMNYVYTSHDHRAENYFFQPSFDRKSTNTVYSMLTNSVTSRSWQLDNVTAPTAHAIAAVTAELVYFDSFACVAWIQEVPRQVHLFPVHFCTGQLCIYQKPPFVASPAEWHSTN